MDIQIAPEGLAFALREGTRALHDRAERSGMVADMLKGRATRSGYGLLLRNLLPAYQALELALERRRTTPGVGRLARRELYRTAALEADLLALAGADWANALPLLPAAELYAHRVAEAAAGTGDGLAGHAYVRYLGDLSGGQILRRLLARSLGLGEAALNFYAFPAVADIAACKRDYIQMLEALGAVLDKSCVVASAVGAFAINIEISEAVHRMVQTPTAASVGAGLSP